MTEKPQLTLNIKSVYGSIYAYPGDEFTKLLLHLKDKRKKQGVKEAPCFDAHDIRWLENIAGELGADLVEVYQLKNKNDEQRWQDEKRLFQ